MPLIWSTAVTAWSRKAIPGRPPAAHPHPLMGAHLPSPNARADPWSIRSLKAHLGVAPERAEGASIPQCACARLACGCGPRRQCSFGASPSRILMYDCGVELAPCLSCAIVSQESEYQQIPRWWDEAA
jgi:hypothetical protein